MCVQYVWLADVQLFACIARLSDLGLTEMQNTGINTHTAVLLTLTLRDVKDNIQQAPTTRQGSIQVVQIFHGFSYSLLVMWKCGWIPAFVWKCLLSFSPSLCPSFITRHLALCLSLIIVRYCIYTDTAR